MSDVVIIGNGPAGISAAIYAVRAGLKTTVIGKDEGALLKAEKVENYYGFVNPISGVELVQTGIDQAKRLGVEFVQAEVVGVGFQEQLIVETNLGSYGAKSVVIATGSSRATPKIKGIAEFEGKGVSYCAVCDAFFYKGQDVAVLGFGEYAVHEVQELLPVVKSVTLLTNGALPNEHVPEGVMVDTRKIQAFQGGELLEQVIFEDGTNKEIAGLFIAFGTAGSADLARKLGAEINGNKIVVDQRMATLIPGLFAAGDCTGGMLQIAKAVYEGARAGTEAVKFCRAKG